MITINKEITYDPKNREMRSAVIRAWKFHIFFAFVVLMMIFPVATSFILYLLSVLLTNSLMFPWSWFFGLSLFILLWTGIISIVIYTTQGKQKINIILSESEIKISSSGTFGKEEIQIKNEDIQKVYIPRYMKTSLWGKYVGCFPVYCKFNKEIKNGISIIHRNKSRNIFVCNSLVEVNEIIEFYHK